MLLQTCMQGDSGCPSYSTNYVKLNPSAISQTPYFTNPAFDTISFVSDKGDTLTFVKGKTDSSWNCFDDNSNADCPKTKANCYQILNNTYKSIKGSGSFNVKHSKKMENKNLSDIITIKLNQYTFLFGDNEIGNNAYIYYVGDITINNTTFNSSIYEYNNDNNTLSVKGYINKGYGLFNVKDNNSNISWVIIK